MAKNEQTSSKQSTLDGHIVNSIVQPLRHTPKLPLEKPGTRLSATRRRCEHLIRLQWPERIIAYEKLRLDMITKLNLADHLTILKYLGRPANTRTSKVRQVVRYMNTGTTVPKEHTFTTQTSRKKGYIEVCGYVEMITDDGKVMFKIFYENLVDKRILPKDEAKGSQPLEENNIEGCPTKNIYHKYGDSEERKRR
jgi:hypothetical protein